MNQINYCCHFGTTKYIHVEDKLWHWVCTKCSHTGTTGEGWTQFCPGCNKTSKTTCSACGCGNCLECGYRFCCNPVDLSISEVNWLNINPVITKEVKFENIDRTNYRIES